MKAAVLHRFGEFPSFEDFPDPVLEQDDVLVRVTAVALENFDRAVARGSHFASRQFLRHLPAIVGSHGIGVLDDGRLVGFGGMRPPHGSMAEIAAVPNTHLVPVPDDIDIAIAATVPSSTLTALFPLKWGAKLQPNESVLINGGTGFAGKLAIQVAKLLGAKRVVATGRDDEALRSLPGLGADGVIDLKQSDKKLAEAFSREAGESGYDIILDFLWGHPTEILIATLVPQEIAFTRHSVRLVQIGEMAGRQISLPADALRTSGLTMIGAGSGLTPEGIAEGTIQVWDWIKAGRLAADIERVPLKDVEHAWGRTDLHGKRIVIIPSLS